MSGVLIVDDDEDTAMSLAMLLELEGLHAHFATDGVRALDAFEQLLPDVVLLDIGLPGLDGYEVARRMRASTCGRQALVIAVTGWTQAEVRQRSRDAGCDHHLVKPVDLDRLRELLGREKIANAASAGGASGWLA
jgi:two-component system, chemotaxis family, CheB/CheR fusion protein